MTRGLADFTQEAEIGAVARGKCGAGVAEDAVAGGVGCFGVEVQELKGSGAGSGTVERSAEPVVACR